MPLLQALLRRAAFAAIAMALSVIWTGESATPIARHVTLVALPETDYVVQLLPYDSDGFALSTTITSLPASGSLFHLSQVYAEFGYDPKRATQISSAPTPLAALASNRVLFAAPLGFTRTQFTYSATNVNGTSAVSGIVYITASDGVVQSSDFVESAEGWQVTAASSVAASWSPTSTGALNHFVYSDEIPLVVGVKNTARWRFTSPAKFHANYARAYNGFLQFYLTSFAGDFTANVRANPKTFVSISCASCNAGAGITLAQRNITYVGDTRLFNFTLNEALVNEWKKDPNDRLVTDWPAPTQCEFYEVLGGITSIAIYPDVTTEYESVALDEVKLVLGDTDASPSCY